MEPELEPVATVYDRPEVVDFYIRFADVLEPERSVLRDFAADFDSAYLLDLGMGGGRTTRLLEPEVGRYVGVDIAPGLVSAAREQFAGVDLRVGDARDLSDFADGCVDVVFFSFNGIDHVRNPDRLEILAEIHRVLRDDGLFVFSTHNRDYERFDKEPWQGLGLGFRPSRRWWRECKRAVRLRPVRRRMRDSEEHTATYAFVNDQAHDYGLLMYHIGEEAQRVQLVDAGFEAVAVYDIVGRPSTGRDTGSVYLHYVARRR